MPDAITSIHIEDGRIAAIYVVRNPDKLGHLPITCQSVQQAGAGC
jgi:hypothetical protein